MVTFVHPQIATAEKKLPLLNLIEKMVEIRITEYLLPSAVINTHGGGPHGKM